MRWARGLLNPILPFAAALSLLALGGCAKPKFIVPGLSLPPGVIGYSFAELEGAGGAFDGACGRVGRILVVGFKSPLGWDAVARHFDAALLEAGFTRREDGVKRAGFEFDPQTPLPLGTLVRSYVNARRKQAVLLADNAGIKLAAAALSPGAALPRSPLLSSSDYALTVIQYR